MVRSCHWVRTHHELVPIRFDELVKRVAQRHRICTSPPSLQVRAILFYLCKSWCCRTKKQAKLSSQNNERNATDKITLRGVPSAYGGRLLHIIPGLDTGAAAYSSPGHACTNKDDINYNDTRRHPNAYDT